MNGELAIGLEKAQALLDKVGNEGDEVIAIEAEVRSGRLLANQRNGKGRVWHSNRLPVSGVFNVAKSADLGERRSLEDAHSQSLAVGAALLKPYTALSPRSISFLPIAKGWQASCPFCFSEASVSMAQDQSKTFLSTADSWCQRAAHAGAIRAVITGGGEPTLVGDESLRALPQHKLTTRLICVLQKGGIETSDDVGAYMDWAERNGASEVCFKELTH